MRLISLLGFLVLIASSQADAATLYSADFETGVATGWTPVTGSWSVCQPAGKSHEYCQSDASSNASLSVVGSSAWADYSVDSVVLMDDETNGRVDVVGRYQDASNFYEIELRKNASTGAKQWALYKRAAGVWTALASGPYSYVSGTYYRLRLTMKGTSITASTSYDKGVTWQALGTVTDSSIKAGKAGVRSQYTAARFDKVDVESFDSSGTLPAFQRVVFVVLENRSYYEIIGNSLLPYFNGLAGTYASATQFWPNVHPSQPNYFIFTTGNIFYQTTALPTGTPNVVKLLLAAGKTWKSYFETPTTSANAFQYLPEVVASLTQKANITTVTQFDADVAAGKLPTYSMVHPSTSNSAHDCPSLSLTCPGFTVADNWLKTHLAPYLASPGFKAGTDLLIIGFDEGDLGLMACNGPDTIPVTAAFEKAGGWKCGDHAPLLIISPKVKAGFKSTTLYHDESILRLMLEAVGIKSGLPGAAATAPAMNEFFR